MTDQLSNSSRLSRIIDTKHTILRTTCNNIFRNANAIDNTLIAGHFYLIDTLLIIDIPEMDFTFPITRDQ